MTTTNQSLGLTIKFTQATRPFGDLRFKISDLRSQRELITQVDFIKSCTRDLPQQSFSIFLRSQKFSGDFVDRVTPVPIPNTEVKPVGADGTARETAWESRKSPGLF